MLENSALIYNFTCEITKLSFQRTARLQGLKIYEWRCHSITRRFRKPKHTKEQIKKDYNRKIRKVLSLKLFCMCVKLKSRYDKQVTKKKKKKRDCGRYLWPVIFIGNQMVLPTTCFRRERLSSFEFVFFFFSFITLKGRLPVKWTAYEALLYGVYTTQSDVWVVNIIWYLKLSCSFFVNYKCSHLPFLSICSWSYGILLYEILTVGKRGLKQKHTQYCLKNS